MALTSTTLSSAVVVDDTSIVVASGTGFAAGSYVVVNGEIMRVAQNYSSGTTIPVLRGQDGSRTSAHDNSSNVVVGPGLDFPKFLDRVGFPKGSGNTVTQTTSRATGVTLHALTGQITTDTTSLAAEGNADFVVTNALVNENDVIALSQRSGSNGGNTDVAVIAVGDGQFTIQVSNNNAAAGTAETGAIVISFAVIRGQRLNS